MTDNTRSNAMTLVIATAVWTVLVPGTLVVVGPYILVGTLVSTIDVLEISFLGVLPMVLGTALYVRSAYDFVREGWGTPAPVKAPVRLVREGPYRYTRNPMYLGVVLILGGEAIVYRDLSVLYYLVVLVLLLHVFVRVYEEPALRRQFADAYRAYSGSVPRWLPNWVGVTELYRTSFLTVGALVLTAGAIAHVLRLSVGLPVIETPLSLHGFLVVLPGYATLGCIVFARRIDFTGAGQMIIYALITGLLLLTFVVHFYSIVARDNSWYGFFPMWYSVVSAILYGGFAYFLRTLRMIPIRVPEVAPH